MIPSDCGPRQISGINITIRITIGITITISNDNVVRHACAASRTQPPTPHAPRPVPCSSLPCVTHTKLIGYHTIVIFGQAYVTRWVPARHTLWPRAAAFNAYMQMTYDFFIIIHCTNVEKWEELEDSYGKSTTYYFKANKTDNANELKWEGGNRNHHNKKHLETALRP